MLETARGLDKRTDMQCQNRVPNPSGSGDLESERRLRSGRRDTGMASNTINLDMPPEIQTHLLNATEKTRKIIPKSKHISKNQGTSLKKSSTHKSYEKIPNVETSKNYGTYLEIIENNRTQTSCLLSVSNLSIRYAWSINVWAKCWEVSFEFCGAPCWRHQLRVPSLGTFSEAGRRW